MLNQNLYICKCMSADVMAYLHISTVNVTIERKNMHCNTRWQCETKI